VAFRDQGKEAGVLDKVGAAEASECFPAASRVSAEEIPILGQPEDLVKMRKLPAPLVKELL